MIYYETKKSTLITPRKSPKLKRSESSKDDQKEKEEVSFEPFEESGMTILETTENDKEENEVFEDDKVKTYFH